MRQSLEVHQLDPSLVVLDITGSILVEEIESGADNLAPLRELGVLIAMDDFGIGYCSLSSLQRFPVDFVKIDGRFIEEIRRR